VLRGKLNYSRGAFAGCTERDNVTTVVGQVAGFTDKDNETTVELEVADCTERDI